MWKIIVGVILCFIVLLCYACCRVAGMADKHSSHYTDENK